jgi:5,5'-dehydrodivanillate O-demethylase
MDDTHTGVLYVIYSPAPQGDASRQSEVPFKYIGLIKEKFDDYGLVRQRHHMKTFASQDGMAWETQGPVANRAREHLASSDKGVVMLRQLLRVQLEKIKRGEDPIGVIRDAAQNQLIEFKVRVIDKTTGKEIPYRDYDRRSFATPVGEKARVREGDKP